MTEDSMMGNLYQRFPVTIERGQGMQVWDTEGKEYLDFMGGYGVALVGHCNKRVVDAIKNQAEKIITVHSSLYSKIREEFLEKIISLAPEKLEQVHMNNSGAESIEAAIKFARKFTGKSGIVAMRGSYHGKSMGALSITFSPKYRKPFEPLLEGVEFTKFGDIESLREIITKDTGMIILEPIQGESGIHVAPNGFLQNVRKLCDEQDIVLVFDEIQAGLGRTGKMWSSEHWDTTPDIMCLAKGIAGGVPMGVTLARADIVSSISKGEHSSTFGGNPLACAAGIATLEALTSDRLVSNAASNGALLKKGLEKLAQDHEIIREVRGMGFMIGIELKVDVRNILYDGIKQGVLLLYSGRNTLRLLPPLVASSADVAKVLGVLEKLFNEEKKRHENS